MMAGSDSNYRQVAIALTSSIASVNSSISCFTKLSRACQSFRLFFVVRLFFLSFLTIIFHLLPSLGALGAPVWGEATGPMTAPASRASHAR